MKRTLLVLSLTLIFLAACMTPPATNMPAPAESTQPIVTEPVASTATAAPVAVSPEPSLTEAPSSPKLPAASFEAQTYVNETAGFALDYPSGWTVKEMIIGDRGSQVQFLSAPEIADLATLPDGATRVNATIYKWDPKNDLAAYIAHWKSAWEGSGFKILDEKQLTLELGLPASLFTIQTPDSTAVFLVTVLGDQYLVLSGEGNLDLVREIVQRVRPISR
jgi:hypothetical protein